MEAARVTKLRDTVTLTKKRINLEVTLKRHVFQILKMMTKGCSNGMKTK